MKRALCLLLLLLAAPGCMALDEMLFDDVGYDCPPPRPVPAQPMVRAPTCNQAPAALPAQTGEPPR
jgi:hypothetical protein